MDNNARHTLLKNFKKVKIFFPAFARAHSTVQSAIEMSLVTEEPNGAIICGRSGTGKSSLCELLYEQYLSTSIREDSKGAAQVTRAVFFEVPADVTVRQLVERMLKKVGVSQCKGTTVQLTAMLLARLKTIQVEVVFLDEIQRLCVGLAERIRPLTLAWLVSFCNELKKPVILAGTEECRDISKGSEAFANRYPYLSVLNFFQYEPRADSDYHRTLQKLDEELHALMPAHSLVHLHDAEIAAGLYVATSGNLKWLWGVIFNALNHCLCRSGSNGLVKGDFLYACDQLTLEFNLLSTGNPFALDLVGAQHSIQTAQKKLQELWVRE